MNYHNIAKKYETASHHTTKIRQIIMLYEGMIKFIANAKAAIINKEIETRFNMIERTIKVVNALKAAIDFNTSGNIAQVLHNYYDEIHKKLLNLHINHDIKTCDEIIEALSVMKSSWIEIEENNLPNQSNIHTKLENLQISV